MDVRCDKCGTEYEFDENRIGPNGVTVKCTNCGHVFKVRRPAAAGAGPAAPVRSAIPRTSTSIGAGPQGKEWLVRKPDGQMIAFRELTTLQKWIVEGRIERDDEISKNGETWKRLGNIMELEPFFSVYEKAQTLNSLIEQQPVELRGSELLAAVNPLEGGQPQAYPIPSRSQIVQADPLPSHLPSQIPQTLPQKPLATDASPTPSLPGPPIPARPVSVAGSAAAMRGQVSGPVSSPGLDRAIEPAAPPPSLQSGTLDFPTRDEDDLDTDDPVADFERGQRTKRVLLAALLLVCLGVGAGAAVAMYGPPDNALRALAIQYGLMGGAPEDDGSTALIEQARQKADVDTVASQTEAIDLLGQALSKRPSDIGLLADRAMRVSLLAETYRQWASDLDADAKAAEALRDAWKAAPKKTRGPQPNLPDLEALRTEAQRHRVRAEKLRGQAEPWLAQAEKEDAGAPRTLRARATMSAAAQAADRAARLDAAEAAAQKAGLTDPVLLYLAALETLEQGETGYAAARAKLTQAMTARPSFLRARALSARLFILQGELPSAEGELANVNKGAPGHEEAKRLQLRLTTAKAAAEAEAKAKAEAETAPPPKVADKPVKKGFDYWIRLADRLRRQDRTTKALNAYGRAAELRPSAAEVHVGKGWCFLDLERPHPALAAFERAIKVNRRYAEAYYGQGEALRALGRKEKAAEAYRAYLDRAPSGAEVRVVKRRLEELGG